MRNVDFDAITGANKSGLRTMAEHVLSVLVLMELPMKKY